MGSVKPQVVASPGPLDHGYGPPLHSPHADRLFK